MNELDKILRFLVDHFKIKRHVWMPNVKHIQENLFPNYNDDQIISLLNQIQNCRPDILTFKQTSAGDVIRISGLTESFLNQGGFTEIELGHSIEQSKKKERENIEFEKTKIDLELAKKMLKEYPKTKWIARISFLIGIIALVVSILQLLSKSP